MRFFAYGVDHMRPLEAQGCLRSDPDAMEKHGEPGDVR